MSRDDPGELARRSPPINGKYGRDKESERGGVGADRAPSVAHGLDQSGARAAEGVEQPPIWQDAEERASGGGSEASGVRVEASGGAIGPLCVKRGSEDGCRRGMPARTHGEAHDGLYKFSHYSKDDLQWGMEMGYCGSG